MPEKKLYRAEITIEATAYIKASSVEEARTLWRAMDGGTAELPDGEFDDITISDCSFDDPDLPDVSISPAVTLSVDSNLDVELTEDE